MTYPDRNAWSTAQKHSPSPSKLHTQIFEVLLDFGRPRRGEKPSDSKGFPKDKGQIIHRRRLFLALLQLLRVHGQRINIRHIGYDARDLVAAHDHREQSKQDALKHIDKTQHHVHRPSTAPRILGVAVALVFVERLRDSGPPRLANEEARGQRDAAKEAAASGVKAKEDKVLLVEHGDAVIDPRTVVVHADDAAVARRAVVRLIGFVLLTRFAKSPRTAVGLQLLRLHVHRAVVVQRDGAGICELSASVTRGRHQRERYVKQGDGVEVAPPRTQHEVGLDERRVEQQKVGHSAAKYPAAIVLDPPFTPQRVGCG